MAYGIFESTNIKGKCLSFTSASDIENGSPVHKGDLAAGETEIYQAVAPAAGTIAATPIYVVGNPAWSYDTSSVINQNEDEFINKAGKAFRVYELQAGDRFVVADYQLTGASPAVGSFVGPTAASNKYTCAGAAPNTAFVGKIVNIKSQGAVYFVGQTVDQSVKKIVIEVVKNA